MLKCVFGLFIVFFYQELNKEVEIWFTLLAEAFPCVSQRCTAILFAVLVARVLFWLFLCRGKDLCRQPFGIPVEHARDENPVTMEFLGHVSVIRCRRRSLPVSFTFSHLQHFMTRETDSIFKR